MAAADIHVFSTTYSAQLNISIRNALLSSPTKPLLANARHFLSYQCMTPREVKPVPRNLMKALRLPPELDLLIMENLSPDVLALQSAALTCRAWLAAARSFLFRYIHLTDDDQMERLLCALRSSTMISSCIQAIRIGDSKESFRGCAAISFLTHLAELAFPPRQLCSLEFYGVYINLDLKTITRLASLSSVASIAFSRCILTPDELCALASVFPNILHLKVEHCGNASGALKSMALPTVHNIALTSLAVDDMNILKDGMVSLLDYLLTTRSRHTLRSVKFMIGDYAAQAVGEFLWALGQNLQHLEMGFWMNVDTIVPLCSKTMQHIDLRHNTSLRTLTLHDPTFPLVQTLLIQVAAPKLDQLTLFWAPKAFASVGRALLPGVLGMPQFSQVKSMRFVYDGSYHAETEDGIRATFKALDEKGIMRVSPAKRTSS